MKDGSNELETTAGGATKLVKSRPTARLVTMAAVLLVAGVALGVGATWLAMHKSVGTQVSAKATAEKPLYQCPMHPTITSDHPGDCPICGMKLVEVKGEAKAAASAGAGERKILFYRSPMDPNQTSPTPREDEMGMDYVPVYEDEAQGGGPSVDGLATVSIDPSRQQLIGLRVAPVTSGSVSGSWRTVGRVEVDPTRVRKTNVKVEGYVERMFVDFVGRPVRRGQPLFSLYSPSLLAAENEYVLALQTRDALDKAGSTDNSGAALVEGSRRKLELWDVPAAEIQRLEQTRTPSRALTFFSPISGVVTSKNVVQGASVKAGDTPYEITDLSEVWVMADAYEGDLASVHVGMPAALTVKTYPGRSFRGKVAFIDPLLDPATRTAKVHMHFPNPGLALKPEMYGDVVLEGRDRKGLRVPVDAVIRSGTKDVVFLALGDGKFSPREVQLGARNGSEVEVRRGLEAGQHVVTRANFLVDSESQLRASLAAMTEKKP
ncbi:MAG TPA: efflux RND transporter periplasmic adaptor subunit [Thermoleophilia bacterium]|nr:efflux RND transporter periplasmic adaptor subunit [Thermoleophilia bacterium]